jgi:2-polyprenyl-6-methoxyphenol hydroxylase-like FAD-dependent oxidoreductase
MSDADIDVLIVGAGPVGLFLANECGRRGLRWRLVEKHSSQSTQSKALAIFPRTMEILDMAGLVDPFLERANRVASVAVTTHGRTLARLRFAPRESSYPFIAMVPQDVTERVLANHLTEIGGEVEYDTAFVSATQDDERVAATLSHAGDRAEVNARFVVGCDGAHSTVRELLKLPFEGGEYSASFMLADIETNGSLPADQLQLCPSEYGPLAIFPIGQTRRRIIATVDHREGDAPSLDVVRRVLRQRAPDGIEARSIGWSSYFYIHHRHTAQLRVGRMFIAGDAAHIHSPFGGQGMNTGLHDAWNLVWKLDLAARGLGNESLLESYTAERVPMIKRVIATTHALTRVLGTPNKAAQALRNSVLPIASRLPSFQRAFVQRLSGLGMAYRGSALIEGAGERYMDDSMRGGEGVRSRFLLFCDNRADPAVQDAAKQLTSSMYKVVELRMRPVREITLVRPDGYVAYSSRGGDAGAALGRVRAMLEAQTSAPRAVASGRSRPADVVESRSAATRSMSASSSR